MLPVEVKPESPREDAPRRERVAPRPAVVLVRTGCAN
jgi:hypothetical protein